MVYKRLRLGELKPTKIVLQLPSRFTRLPMGMVEDVLIKEGEFIFSVGFVVLETEAVMTPENKIPVIPCYL